LKSTAINDIGKRIAEAGKRLYEHGLIVGTSGNISARIPATDTFLIKPSGAHLGFLKPEQLVLVDLEGNKVRGDADVSVETPMHAAIYKARNDAQAVVHTHPTTATAFGIAGIEILPLQIEMFMRFPQGVPIVPFKLPGSTALAKAIQKKIKHFQAVILENHGIVTVGSTIEETCDINEMIEEAAKVQFTSMMLVDKDACSLGKLKKKFKTRNAIR
jgi:L-fuculose-phosphate aldolase